jgi:putative transposase
LCTAFALRHFCQNDTGPKGAAKRTTGDTAPALSRLSGGHDFCLESLPPDCLWLWIPAFTSKTNVGYGMRRSQHTDEEILYLLEEAKRGIAVSAICETAHVSLRTFYRWKRRLDGVSPKGLERIKSLEAENARLKRQLADSASTGPEKRPVVSLSRRTESRPELGSFLSETDRAPSTAPKGAAKHVIAPSTRIGRFASVRLVR